MASLFHKNLTELKGVGEKTAQLFYKLGVTSVGALLRLYPRTYEDWSHPVSILEAPLDKVSCIKAVVSSPVTEHRIRKGMTLYKVRACDGRNVLHITFFNNRFVKSMLKEDGEYLFYGRVTGNLTAREMTSPQFLESDKGSPLRPIYPQTEGLSSRQVERAMKEAVKLLPTEMRDPVPLSIRSRYGLCSLDFAIRNIHFPADEAVMEKARERLIFEELLLLQLGLMRLKSRQRCENRQRLAFDATKQFWKLLPFTPTNAQRRVVSECVDDMMQSPSPMNRLVQGDVGSGKTAVAAALCYSIVQNRMQAAFMAPTEILAAQHYESLTSILRSTNVATALLTGSTPAAARRQIIDKLQTGEIGLVIGTHALLNDNVQFHRLGLVVTDEQHRFGVEQRATLAAKGECPHLLVMSATPIPRTLALMIYGDLDLSILDELPPGRRKIETYWVDSSKRERAFHFIKARIAEGRQAFIVCPLIEQGESDLVSAESYLQKLTASLFSADTVGLLHGRMSAREKDEVMERFTKGELRVLVSTTVIEVGVDVPNAAVMLIENAERFGLSQLHQLRGRVGRGAHQSYCILISDAQNEEAKGRLTVMTQTNDGFKIAEEDLKLRGPGDFFGSRQHGLPALKIADLMDDMTALNLAQETAREILETDPTLSAAEHKGLKAQCEQMFHAVGEYSFN